MVLPTTELVVSTVLKKAGSSNHQSQDGSYAVLKKEIPVTYADLEAGILVKL
jgi:hypothetical protein